MIEHYRYSAFGEIEIFDELGARIASTQIANTITWNTRRQDNLTGFYLYKYRHYSPQLGRWPSRDPIEEQGGYNLYGFVGNDGVNAIDFLGLDEVRIPIKWRTLRDPHSRKGRNKSKWAKQSADLVITYDKWSDGEGKDCGVTVTGVGLENISITGIPLEIFGFGLSFSLEAVYSVSSKPSKCSDGMIGSPSGLTVNWVVFELTTVGLVEIPMPGGISIPLPDDGDISGIGNPDDIQDVTDDMQIWPPRGTNIKVRGRGKTPLENTECCCMPKTDEGVTE